MYGVFTLTHIKTGVNSSVGTIVICSGAGIRWRRLLDGRTQFELGSCWFW